MKSVITRASACLLCLLSLGCCCTGAPSPPEAALADSQPQDVILSFGRHLQAKEWKKAYLLLSKETRKRYSPFQFRQLFEKTIIGGLLFWQFTNWDLVKLDVNAEKGEGTFTFRHPVQKDCQRTFRLALETTMRKREDGSEETVRAWLLKFTIAELLNMPDEDEAALFPHEF